MVVGFEKKRPGAEKGISKIKLRHNAVNKISQYSEIAKKIPGSS